MELTNRVPHFALAVIAPTMENSDYCNQAGHLKNCYLSFNSDNSEKCLYSKGANRSFNCVDCFKVYDCQNCYESLNCNNCSFSTYLIDSHNSSDCHFSSNLIRCNNCFGCVNLRNSEYGEFFGAKFSPFGYNETTAFEYFPLKKNEVLQRQWPWQDEKDPNCSGVEKIIKAKQLPRSIQEVGDDILESAIECEKTGRLFKIQKAELSFYRSMNIPIPHFHPDVRHFKRLALRNSRKLYDRPCTKCSKTIQTTYAQNRLEKVYCEKCYLNEVY